MFSALKLTDGIVGTGNSVIEKDLEKEDHHENHDGGRGEVGDVKESAEAAHKRIGRYGGHEQYGGQLNAKPVNERCQCIRSTCVWTTTVDDFSAKNTTFSNLRT